jgi:exodeoxyribonuclease V alpha subunit
MEVQTGIVSRVVWRSEDSDRKILLVRYESPTGLVDGRMAVDARDVSEGDWFSAHGQWRAENYRGQQAHIFQAKSFRPELPSSEEGARAFLGKIFDGSRHGVDFTRIAGFVRKHGPQCCRKAEQDAEILLELSSDPARYRNRMLTDWNRRISNRRAVILMEGAGVGRGAIGRILDAFRDSTWEVLRANPYRVSRVPTVGFDNADKIGTVMNIPKDDRRRLDAAFTSLLDESRFRGSTALSASDLVRMAEAKFKFPQELSTAWIKHVATDANGSVVVDRSIGGFVAQLPELFRAEAYIARAALRLMSEGRRNDRRRIETTVNDVMRNPEFARFDPVQVEAIASSVSEPISILTGGPGTGKTTVTKAIAGVAAAIGEGPIILAAPTGKAAKRMQEATGREATTIHRMLLAQEDRRTGGSVFRINRENPLPRGCFVVVDEASMLDVETMAAIFDALPDDGRLLLVGDRNQLPSVGAGNVLADLLHAAKGDNAVIPAVELINVYRQKGNSAIATGAAKLRDGQVPSMDNVVRGGLTMLENEGAKIVDRISHLMRVGGFIRDKLGLDPRKDVAILCPQAPGIAGTWEINRRLSAELNPEGREIDGVQHGPDDDRRMPLPRVGDRVMMTENDDENDIMNGDVGTILDATEKEHNGRKQRVMKIAFDCHAAEGRTTEYPVTRWRSLILAYACTVHKAQGSQWPCVILPMTMAHENMLDRTLLYTGWTRAQDVLMVIGEREAVEYAAETVKAIDRGTRLKEFVERLALETEFRPSGRPRPAAAARPAVRPSPPLVPQPPRAVAEPAPTLTQTAVESATPPRVQIRRPPGLPSLQRAVATPVR